MAFSPNDYSLDAPYMYAGMGWAFDTAQARAQAEAMATATESGRFDYQLGDNGALYYLATQAGYTGANNGPGFYTSGENDYFDASAWQAAQDALDLWMARKGYVLGTSYANDAVGGFLGTGSSTLKGLFDSSGKLIAVVTISGDNMLQMITPILLAVAAAYVVEAGAAEAGAGSAEAGGVEVTAIPESSIEVSALPEAAAVPEAGIETVEAGASLAPGEEIVSVPEYVYTPPTFEAPVPEVTLSPGAVAPSTSVLSDITSAVKSINSTVGTALSLVSSFKKAGQPAPRTSSRISASAPTGQPMVLPDGSVYINNGDGTYTTIDPAGNMSTHRFESMAGAGVQPWMWIAGAAVIGGLVLATRPRR